MIFAVQTCSPRDSAPLVRRLMQQRDPMPGGVATVLPVVDVAYAGQLATMLRAFKGAEQLGQTLTLLEDDIEVCADFVPFVADRWRYPGCHVVQWYVPGDFDGRHIGGWCVQEGADFNYLQATTFSSEFIRAVLAYEGLDAFIDTHRHDGDQLVAATLFCKGWNYAIRVPGGVQHTGAESLIHTSPNPLRRNRLRGGLVSKHYVGRDGRMGGP